VIDFIDMEKPESKDRVFTSLIEALSKDKAKTNVLPMSELGLIEMTRKRTRENLCRFLTEPCFYCEGRGVIKSFKTISYEIFRDIEREPPPVSDTDNKIYVQVNPDIADAIKEDEQQFIMELEKRIKRRIIILSRKDYHVEQYTIST
jgi:ribonuclease G